MPKIYPLYNIHNRPIFIILTFNSQIFSWYKNISTQNLHQNTLSIKKNIVTLQSQTQTEWLRSSTE